MRKRTNLEVEVGAGATGNEGLLERLGHRAHDAVVQGELAILVHVLAKAEHFLAFKHQVGGHLGGTHNLDVGEAGPVAGGHVLVHL